MTELRGAPRQTVWGPPTNPHAASLLAYRTSVDDVHLHEYVGRIVYKYFPGYGNFLGKITRKVDERPVVEISYEDGDGEELYLDQMLQALMPLDTLPIRENRDPDSNDKYGFVWPPPTTSARLLINTERQRKPSPYQLEKERIAREREFARQEAMARKERGRIKREEKQKRDEAQAKAKKEKEAQEKKSKAKRELEAKRREKARNLKEAQALEAKRKKLKLEHEKKQRDAAAAKAKKVAAAEDARKKKQSETTSKASVSSSKATSSVHKHEDQTQTQTQSQKRPHKRRKTTGKNGRVWCKCERCDRKHWSDANCSTRQHVERCDSSSPEVDEPASLNPTVNAKRWSGNSTAALLVSLTAQVQVQANSNSDPPLLETSNGRSVSQSPSKSIVDDPLGALIEAATSSIDHSSLTSSSDGDLDSRANSNSSTTNLLMHNNNNNNSNSNATTATATTTTTTTTNITNGNGNGNGNNNGNSNGISNSNSNNNSIDNTNNDGSNIATTAVTDVYNIIKSKIDITCGGDGYGMTGNVTKASMQRLFDVMREKFEFDETAWFMDLGHGMGRPSIHASVLLPHIAGAFGTEFNPQLYKQSMLALNECTQRVPVMHENPKVFFLDQNIKSMTSLNPFTHVYTFQIGMPEDVVQYVLELIKISPSVKYLIIYPHRTVSVKRLSEIGEIVFSMSMSMPGGCSYEVNIVKVKHSPENITPKVDPDVQDALVVLKNKMLYAKYLEQLGMVTALEDEEWRQRMTRGSRRQVSNSRFLEQSPCIPDINYGFLRRIAIALGVSTVGGKVQILSNIQEYCPVSFGLSMFVVGENYSESNVRSVVEKLLAVAPSRRQPEALHS